MTTCLKNEMQLCCNYCIMFYRHEKYVRRCQNDFNNSQPRISNFIATSSCKKFYSSSSKRAQDITESIMMDLVIGESMPMRLVESKGFTNFLNIVDPQYKIVCRQTLKNKIHLTDKATKEKIVSKLFKAEAVNTTVDIWSDRKMRSFLGITAHMIEEENNNLKLVSYTLLCQRFLGKHTGEHIASVFYSTLDDFKIKSKVDCIITDNAANMKKAFTTTFSIGEQCGDSVFLSEQASICLDDRFETDVALDDDSIWLSLDECESNDIIVEIIDSARRARLSCYAHTLQLCIRDGLEHSKCKYEMHKNYICYQLNDFWYILT